MDNKGKIGLIIAVLIVMVIIMIVILILVYRYKPTSATSSAATGCPNVAPPGAVLALSSQLTNIQVTWNASANAVTYRVYIGTIPGFTQGSALSSYLTGATQYYITGMLLGRTYYIAVTSINSCGAESLFSQESSVTLGFPAQFRIVSRAQPSLALKVGTDFVDVEADNFCSGVAGDNLCIWTYNSSASSLSIVGDPTNCMDTFPTSVDTRVKYQPCGDPTYYNSYAAFQWNYNSSEGTLCNPYNPEGLNCIKLPGAQTPGTQVTRTTYDGTLSMQWDILQA